MTIRINALILLLLLVLPLLAHAATETRHYRGEMEFVKLSGASCGNKIKQGDRIPINLVVRISGENIDGYYAGQKIATGHFSGNRADALSISFPEENSSVQTGHRLSLVLSGDSPSGEIREKPLEVTELGCNFDLARLALVSEVTGSADLAFDKLAKRFKAKYENSLGILDFDKGNLPEAIKHFETEIKILEELDGFTSESLIEPLLVLSVAYCASDRFDKGKELHDRVFAIPMDAFKRKTWRFVAMQKLIVEQAKLMEQKGKPEKGIALLEKAITAYPDITALYFNLAEMMIENGAAQEACTRIGTAWVNNQEDNNLQNAQAVCLVRKSIALNDPENPDIAISLLEQAWKLAPDNLAILIELNNAYVAMGTPETALILIKENKDKIIKVYGQSDYDRIQAAVYAFVSNIDAKKHDYKIAESKLRTALELDPANTSYTLELASVVHKAGRFEEAMLILNTWQKKCPDDACRGKTAKAIEHEHEIESILQKLSRK